MSTNLVLLPVIETTDIEVTGMKENKPVWFCFMSTISRLSILILTEIIDRSLKMVMNSFV